MHPWKEAGHLTRLAVVLVVAIVAFAGLRQMVVPKDWPIRPLPRRCPRRDPLASRQLCRPQRLPANATPMWSNTTGR